MDIEVVETTTTEVTTSEEETSNHVKNDKSILRKDLGVCQMCTSQPAKYSCPGCEVPFEAYHILICR